MYRPLEKGFIQDAARKRKGREGQLSLDHCAPDRKPNYAQGNGTKSERVEPRT